MKVRFIYPGDLNTPTGGYHYDRQIIMAWKEAGIGVDCVSLEGNFPFPDEVDISSAITKLSSKPLCDITTIDALAGGASSQLMEAVAKSGPVVSLIHHPLCLESGLTDEAARNLKQQEQSGLNFVDHVVTTSQATKTTVHKLFGYPETQITNILPGVERKSLSEGGNSKTINLLCVASIIERKGHRFLIEALADLSDLDWKLDCIGMIDAEPELYEWLLEACRRNNLSDRIVFHGAVDSETLDAAYMNADLFVLPSLYEGYGMVYAEAITRGLPVIATNAGAIPDTVPSRCGLLVEPSNTAALRNALRKVLEDEDLRFKMRQAAIDAEPGFPTWKNSASQFAIKLRSLL